SRRRHVRRGDQRRRRSDGPGRALWPAKPRLGRDRQRPHASGRRRRLARRARCEPHRPARPQLSLHGAAMRAALFFTAALIAAPAAYAQNSQYNAGAATATTELEVGAAYDAAATATAGGNVVTTSVEEDEEDLFNLQH